MTHLSNRRLRFLRSRRFPTGRLQLYIEPRDLWIGAFVSPDALYVIFFPAVVIRWSRQPEGEPAPIDAAMHTVWLEGNWRWLTRRMTTEEREAAVAAVLRYDRVTKANEPAEELLTRRSLVWWD